MPTAGRESGKEGDGRQLTDNPPTAHNGTFTHLSVVQATTEKLTNTGTTGDTTNGRPMPRDDVALLARFVEYTSADAPA